MNALTRQVVIVTEVSTGIGTSIAKGLAEAGASVVVNAASSREDADRVVADIEHTGGTAIAVQAEISHRADGEQGFDQTGSAFERVIRRPKGVPVEIHR